MNHTPETGSENHGEGKQGHSILETGHYEGEGYGALTHVQNKSRGGIIAAVVAVFIAVGVGYKVRDLQQNNNAAPLPPVPGEPDLREQEKPPQTRNFQGTMARDGDFRFKIFVENPWETAGNERHHVYVDPDSIVHRESGNHSCLRFTVNIGLEDGKILYRYIVDGDQIIHIENTIDWESGSWNTTGRLLL